MKGKGSEEGRLGRRRDGGQVEGKGGGDGDRVEGRRRVDGEEGGGGYVERKKGGYVERKGEKGSGE